MKEFYVGLLVVAIILVASLTGLLPLFILKPLFILAGILFAIWQIDRSH